jgi:post-segregation antitoxin (ccd killing protein)
MARVNVYLPDDLAEAARAAGLSMSRVTQEAVRRDLARRVGATWLDRVRQERPSGVTHERVLDALDAVRAEAGDEWPDGLGIEPSR